MRLTAPILTLSLLPFAAFAAGTEDAAPPTQTQTTTECAQGLVWDEATKACVAPEDARLDDDARYDAAREFAYFGQPEAALRTLAAMTEGDTDRVLTYRAFASRKAGNIEEGLALYDAALAQNPDNILARSYLGQLLVQMDELAMARAQLDEIRARDGAGTWAEASLAEALTTGRTTNY